jgi:hypothetical protein
MNHFTPAMCEIASRAVSVLCDGCLQRFNLSYAEEAFGSVFGIAPFIQLMENKEF